ncbi:MAG: hypothetical protein ABR551_01230 [Gemmatimonadales bacterium]
MRPPTGAAVIAAYHDALTPSLAAESWEWLTGQLSRRGLVFGTRPLCTVLRPRFLTTAEYAQLRGRIPLLLAAFARAHTAALADPSVMAQFRPEPWEAELAQGDRPMLEAGASPLGRVDAFFDPAGGSFKVTEYNAETPAGAAYNDALVELFQALPAMRPVMSRFDVRGLPARAPALHAILDAWHRWSGRRDRPSIAILDWPDVPTWSEFLLWQAYFEAMGYPCIVADVREAEYRGGALWVGGHKVDLVYKRVLIAELVGREGLDSPLVRAVRDHAVCMVNPFACKLLHKKASLAVLSDERNARLFRAAEQAAINEHVPWTRLVEERHTTFHGREVDLLPHILQARDQMVLKPNDDYGGAGIVLGWEVSDAEWEVAVRRAVAEPFIVQERIGLPSESFPSMDGANLVFADRIVDTAPFVQGGTHVDGCLSRISSAALVNVTAGGGSTVPTFVVGA